MCEKVFVYFMTYVENNRKENELNFDMNNENV